MFCKSCGKYVTDDKGVCPYCGKPVNATGTGKNNPPYQEVASGGWVFLGLLFPLIGFILAIACRNSKPSLAKRSLIGAIIGIAVNVVLTCLIYFTGIIDLYIEAITSMIV